METGNMQYAVCHGNQMYYVYWTSVLNIVIRCETRTYMCIERAKMRVDMKYT